jgi:hypothetical protein
VKVISKTCLFLLTLRSLNVLTYYIGIESSIEHRHGAIKQERRLPAVVRWKRDKASPQVRTDCRCKRQHATILRGVSSRVTYITLEA